MFAPLRPVQVEAISRTKLEGHSIEKASRALGQSVALMMLNIHRGLEQLVGTLEVAVDAD